MIELLEQRKAELKAKYKKTPDIEIYVRISEVNILIKRYKKLIEAEVDAAGFREELGNLVALMSGLEADKDRPGVICDKNGQVVLSLCKSCGRGEAELETSCDKAKQEQNEPETLNYTVSVECKRCGSHEKYDLEVDYPPPQQRKPLTRKDIDRLHEEDCFSGNIYEITAEIEAAHGINKE